MITPSYISSKVLLEETQPVLLVIKPNQRAINGLFISVWTLTFISLITQELFSDFHPTKPFHLQSEFLQSYVNNIKFTYLNVSSKKHTFLLDHKLVRYSKHLPSPDFAVLPMAAKWGHLSLHTLTFVSTVLKLHSTKTKKRT